MSWHEGRPHGKGIIEEKCLRAREYSVLIAHEYSILMQAHFTVLQWAHVVLPYVEKHKKELATTNISRSQAWLDKQHREKFAKWLQQYLLEVTFGDPNLDVLAIGPNDSVVMYQGYDINAYTFYTTKQDKECESK